jgi:hypothetical protein
MLAAPALQLVAWRLGGVLQHVEQRLLDQVAVQRHRAFGILQVHTSTCAEQVSA